MLRTRPLSRLGKLGRHAETTPANNHQRPQNELLGQIAARLPTIDAARNRRDRRGRLNTAGLAAAHRADMPIPGAATVLFTSISRKASAPCRLPYRRRVRAVAQRPSSSALQSPIRGASRLFLCWLAHFAPLPAE
jgi:hypothetical protein